MIIGLLKEPPFEKRVALLPEAVVNLKKLNASVIVEKGAGELASASDADYVAAGATMVSRSDVFAQADAVVKINPFSPDETALLKAGQVVLAVLNPFQNKDLINQLTEELAAALD